MDTVRLHPKVSLPEGFATGLDHIVGPHGWTADPATMAPYLAEERRLFEGRAGAVVRPGSTEEVALVVHLCAMMSVPIFPQGGNTGLCGGGVPDGGIVLATDRLTRICAVDPINRAITVEAGVILADVQAAADAAGALFPLSLGAEGSCRIGGNLSTNAGGISVVRYGTARDLVLGLEVVLADGTIWNGLKRLRKDNSGYDLKQLFIGSEGTLGIITAAVLKLFPKPRVSETAMAAVPSIDAAVELFRRTFDAAGDCLTAFELLSDRGLGFCLQHIPGTAAPFAGRHPWYTLIRLTSPRTGDGLRDALEGVLAAALEDGVVEDAVIAQSEGQAAALWRIRETIPEAQKHEGGSIKNDISVPLSRAAAFVAEASKAVEAAMPGIRVVAFGHLGDGNIHFNLSQPVDMERQAFMDRWRDVERIVADIACEFGGSFSAEHGVGRLKRDSMSRYKFPAELAMMAALKKALDPAGILNPGKVLPDG